MDIQDVKNMLSHVPGMDTNKHDAYLTTMVPLLLEHAGEYCNNSFDEESLPAGVKLYVAKAVEFNMKPANLKSRTMGEVSYTYDTELPKSIMKYLAPHRKVRFV